jgi:hypothetical protein
MRLQTNPDVLPKGPAWLAALESWDLTSVRLALQARAGWSDRLASDVEREYRRFLALVGLLPGEQFGMAGLVDEFWHEHILDTRAYAALCAHVFGRFIHHSPAAEQDVRDSNAYARTHDALISLFGEAPEHIWPAARNVSRCATGCIDKIQSPAVIN